MDVESMMDDRSLFSSPAALEVAELARSLGGARDLADAATRTVNHAVDVTGARWANWSSRATTARCASWRRLTSRSPGR